MNSRLSLETFLCLVYLVIRASPTGKPNEELNLKTCTFNFFYNSNAARKMIAKMAIQYVKSYFYVYVEIAKIKLSLPTAIFIAVGQQFFLFFKSRRKETCFFFKSCIMPHPSLKFRKTRINYSLIN